MPNPAILVKNLSKTFDFKRQNSIFSVLASHNSSYRKKLAAIDNISFEVNRGEILGIIGLNGSGKTTLLRIIAGVYKPDSGTVEVNGKISPILHIGIGFEDELTPKDNIITNGMLLGMSKSEIENLVEEIIEFAELKEFSHMRIKHFSSGMQARLAISIALKINSDILLVDEILAAGDQTFKEKCRDAFLSFKNEKKTMIIASHSKQSISELCDRVLLLHRGKIVTMGAPKETFKRYSEMVKDHQG